MHARPQERVGEGGPVRAADDEAGVLGGLEVGQRRTEPLEGRAEDGRRDAVSAASTTRAVTVAVGQRREAVPQRGRDGVRGHRTGRAAGEPRVGSSSSRSRRTRSSASGFPPVASQQRVSTPRSIRSDEKISAAAALVQPVDGEAGQRAERVRLPAPDGDEQTRPGPDARPESAPMSTSADERSSHCPSSTMITRGGLVGGGGQAPR